MHIVTFVAKTNTFHLYRLNGIDLCLPKKERVGVFGLRLVLQTNENKNENEKNVIVVEICFVCAVPSRLNCALCNTAADDDVVFGD